MSNKTRYLIANWKMNPTSTEDAKNLASNIANGIDSDKGVKVVICPPFPYLYDVKEQLSNKVKLGAQNCYFEDKGSYTGEISPLMISNIGSDYVIVGHSERRKYFSEKGELIAKKVQAVLKHDITPILAVGEKDREGEDSDTVVEEQLKNALGDLSESQFKNVLIAYEPVWAIGTGVPADTNTVLSMRLYIQKVLKSLFSESAVENTPILYGGSTDSNNVLTFVDEAKMDGALVGGSSLDPKEFIAMHEALR